MGYGARALELLRDYYNGRFTDIMAAMPPKSNKAGKAADRDGGDGTVCAT
jgi:hypothetical protein